MLIYEIDRATLKQYGGNVQKVIAAGDYIPRGDGFISRVGAERFKRYRDNNKHICKWYDAERQAFI